MPEQPPNDKSLPIAPQTPDEAIAYASKAGIQITPDDLIEMQHLMDTRRTMLETEQESAASTKGRASVFVENFNRFYPKFLRTLIGVGDVLITATQTILIAFGVPGVLIMLLIVEQQRVVHGISLFEVREVLAGFSASALVALNLILELLISWIEHQTDFKEPPKNEFSLALWAARWQYILGKSSKWEARKKSPAMRFKVVLRIVTISILTLALAGSMQAVIETTQGNWLQAIIDVATKSSLLQASTWLGGLLFALAAVLSAQALAQYVARKVVEVVDLMQKQIDDKPQAIAKAAGLTGVAYIMAKIKETQKQRRNPTTPIVVASNFPSPSATSGAIHLSGSSGMEAEHPAEAVPTYRKRMDARAVVREYYERNPSALTESPLKVAERLHIGKSTVYEVRNEMRGKNG